MSRLCLLALLGLPIFTFAGQAEVIDDDDPRKPLPKPETSNSESKQPVERLPLIVDEPGFKAKVVFPEKPVPDYGEEAKAQKTQNSKISRRGWGLPQEEGVDSTATPDNAPTATAEKDVPEEISPALAKVIAKEKSGKKLKDLLPAYQEVADAEPNSAAAHYRYGLILARSGEGRKGAAELEKAVNLQPRNSKYMCDFGLIALQAGWFEKALLACQSAAVAQPANARYQSALGDCLLNTGRIPQAAEAYTRAIQLEPTNAEYIHNLSLAHLHGSAFKKCIEIVDQAIQLKPEHSAYYCTRGLAQENNKNIKDALTDYKHAVALDKNNAYAHYLLACIYSDPNDPTYTSAYEAAENAVKAVQLTQSRNPQYLMGLARAMRVSRYYDQAVDAARKAVALDPRDDYKKELATYEKLKGESLSGSK